MLDHVNLMNMIYLFFPSLYNLCPTSSTQRGLEFICKKLKDFFFQMIFRISSSHCELVFLSVKARLPPFLIRDKFGDTLFFYAPLGTGLMCDRFRHFFLAYVCCLYFFGLRLSVWLCEVSIFP